MLVDRSCPAPLNDIYGPCPRGLEKEWTRRIGYISQRVQQRVGNDRNGQGQGKTAAECALAVRCEHISGPIGAPEDAGEGVTRRK